MRPLALLALAWCAVVAMAALGWGRILGRISGRPAGPWPTTAGIGLAALVGAGGVLNLARLALAPSLVAPLAVGLLACLPSLRRWRPALPAGIAARLELLLAGAIVLGASGLAAATIAAPRVFNFHDDLQKYLGHPVRMLATGTLAAGLLSALGFETLGGQAFLHGLLLAVLPIPYAAALDGVLAFTQLLLLAARAGWRRLAYFPAAAVVPLLAWVNAPYHLDLARNPVEVVDPTAFGTPWARLPEDARYVLWQYRCYATRSPDYLRSVARGPGAHERRTASRIALFTEKLARLTARGEVLADDGEIRLVRLPAGGPAKQPGDRR